MIEKSPVLAVAVGLLLMGLSLQRAQAQTDCPIETKILPEDGVPDDDNFAWSVALGGASAFVAAPDEESGAGSGSVHVYVRAGLEWIFQEKLVPEDAVSNQFFGSAIALEEDRIVIGAMLDSQQEIAGGAAYVFHFDGSGWTQEQKLLPSTGQFLMLFGAAVDVFEDRIVVGTAGSINGDESGWVVVFRHDGEKWVEEQQIIPASGSSGDQFGVGVTIDNEVLAVRAPLDDEFGLNVGAVYVYRLNGSTWTEEAKLFPTGKSAGPLSGNSLVLIDDTLYVGAPSDNADGAEAGAVYVFRYEDSVWIQVDRLSASDGEAGDSFGSSVAVNGSVAVFGNFVDDDLAPNAGSAYVFHHDGDAWEEWAKLLASDGGPDDNFGASVAVSGDTALIGASFDEILGKGHSAAYVYDGLGVIDCNENGIADNCDIIRGTSQDCTGNWIPDECEPDCNTNGVADSCDIAQGTSEDCTGDGIPDECEPDCNENGMADSCDIAQGAGDCNENDVPDECDIAEGTSVDCNANLIPDECEPEEPDCNDNGIADSCDIAQGTSQDCTANGIPDECEPDCNDNGMADSCDIADGSSDCNENAIPDECDIAQGTSEDCNGNELPDECEPDCNTNGVADSCDIAQGTSQDCTDNGIPDECEPDCDENGFADSCEIAHGASDCNENGVPDECDLVVSEHTIAPAIDPWQVFAADFDGDGDADALAPLEGSHEIAWYENTDGMGSFGKTHYISLDAFLVRSVFAADLDGDGDTDVLSASADGKVAWYENTDGLGSFGPEQVITANADGAQFVFAADLDGDGDTDVLSASFIDDKIAWYENTDGLGNFGPEQIVTTAADNARSVFAADLDGDGDADVLSASIDDDKIAWYENTDSLGNFGPQRVITTGANGARSVVAADLDGDGDADVLSASFDSDEIAWYENTDGLASFGPPQIITNTADGAESVFVADMDGDGHADVLSASFWDDKIAWYKNTDGLGNFGPQEVISTAADGAISVFAADLDGDGDLDVLSASFDADIAWYAIPVASDCNEDGIPDLCDIEGGTSLDCSGNGIPDDCDIAEGTSEDCNLNGFPDECDLASGTSADENGTGVPDECETVLFVYGEAAGGNDGTSWADAFTSLQDALTAAGANDAFHTEIWVAAGVHSPTDPGGDRNDTFALLNDVSIYGGFSASEMTRAQRDPAVNVTILSGDLNADDPTSDCCEANGSPGCNDGECEDSVCAVISSCCDLEWDDVCAALAASLCGDCAGGVGDNSYHVVTASATDETAILDGFTVTAGHADGVAADGEGGGVHIILGSPTISNCVVVGNFADAGGGMYTLDGSPVLFNCLFSGNSGGVGGGLRASGGFPTLVNCTFGDNHALSIGGGIYVFSGAVGVTNCILWGNTGEVDPTIEASQILLLASTAVVSYTDIEGLDTFAGNGNIGSDPLFVDPGADFHLSPGSPCIDAANNDMVPRDSSDLDGDGDTSEPASLDLDGNPRFVDDPATEDTGIPGTPGPPVVDMGVHEFQVQKKLCEGDANGDGLVDPLDAGFVLARFGCPVGTGDPSCDIADQNGDGVVDPLDVGYVLARFGECR